MFFVIFFSSDHCNIYENAFLELQTFIDSCLDVHKVGWDFISF